MHPRHTHSCTRSGCSLKNLAPPLMCSRRVDRGRIPYSCRCLRPCWGSCHSASSLWRYPNGSYMRGSWSDPPVSSTRISQQSIRKCMGSCLQVSARVDRSASGLDGSAKSGYTAAAAGTAQKLNSLTFELSFRRPELAATAAVGMTPAQASLWVSTCALTQTEQHENTVN